MFWGQWRKPSIKLTSLTMCMLWVSERRHDPTYSVHNCSGSLSFFSCSSWALQRTIVPDPWFKKKKSKGYHVERPSDLFPILLLPCCKDMNVQNKAYVRQPWCYRILGPMPNRVCLLLAANAAVLLNVSLKAHDAHYNSINFPKTL